MVILFCQTPRSRGMVAVVNYAPLTSLGRADKNSRQSYKSGKGTSRDDDHDARWRRRRKNRASADMTATPTNGRSCFPFAVNCRFDKTFFGVPKKCGYCQKMVYGTGFACQNCRFRCHKRCVMLVSNSQPYLRQKVCSLSRLPVGDDKIVKELMTKCEINCNNYASTDDDMLLFHERRSMSTTPEPPLGGAPYGLMYSYPSSPLLSLASDGGSTALLSSLETIDESAISSPGNRPPIPVASAPGMVQRFFNFFPSWNKTVVEHQDAVVANPVEFSISSRKSSFASMTTTSSQKHNAPQGEILLKSYLSEPGCFSNNHNTNVANNHNNALVQQNNNTNNSHNSNHAGNLKLLDLSSFPPGGVGVGCGGQPSSSSCSPQVRTPVDEFNSIVLDELFNQSNNQCKMRQQLQRKLKWVSHIVGDRGAYSQDCMTSATDGKTSCKDGLFKGHIGATPVRQSGVSLHNSIKDKLVASWPLSGLHMNFEDDVDMQHHTEHCDEEACYIEEELRKRDSRVSELGEWTIPYCDIEFGDCLLETRTMKVYKGKWHGDVMIHSYNLGENNHLIGGFLDDVRTLTKIRHENVALFMGASIEAPLLAVVTSVRKGDTLYETLYVKQKRISQHTKVAVARQVAQGMGYLHAKGVVLKSLSSKCIYLECKVKISMVDDGTPLKLHDRYGKGCVRRGHLTYFSPELIRTIRVEPPALVADVGRATKESDVYAFGTVLYEMFAGDFPFTHVPTETLIWQIGNGLRQSLSNVTCSTSLKTLIDVCWSTDSTLRPSFMSIFKELQHTAALHRRHSSSMPEELNKTGMPLSKYLYYQ